MKNVLEAEKVPYFFGLLLVIIGVQFNYIINGVFEVPVIEYSYNVTNEKDTLGFCKGNLIVNNISNGKLIEDFQLKLIHSSHSDSRLIEPNIDAIPPSSMALIDPTFNEDKVLYYPIAKLQPGSRYSLTFKTNDVVNEPKLFFEAKAPVRMMRESWKSYLLKNHIQVNGAIMIALVIVSVLYLIKILKNMKTVTIVTILLLAIPASAYCQCKIKLVRMTKGDSVGVQFTLQVSKDNILTSDENGQLVVPDETYRRYKGSDTHLEIYNNSDKDVYRAPMWTRTRRKLSEYCGQRLVIDDRFK